MAFQRIVKLLQEDARPLLFVVAAVMGALALVASLGLKLNGETIEGGDEQLGAAWELRWSLRLIGLLFLVQSIRVLCFWHRNERLPHGHFLHWRLD